MLNNISTFESVINDALEGFGDDVITMSAFESFLETVISEIGDEPITMSAFESVLNDALSEFGDDVLTMSAFESFLEAAIKEFGDDRITLAGFEAIVTESINSIGLESMFGEDVVSRLLAQAKENMLTKCQTVEECDQYMEKITAEATKYNNALMEIKTAAEEFKTEQIDKATFAARIKPYLDELKNSCEVINICSSDAEMANDDDIANLKAFIIGVKDIIIAHREALSRSEGGDTPNTNDALESVINTIDGLTIAEEGNITHAFRIRFSTLKKDASALIKEARKDIKSGNYTDAIAKLQKAKTAYKQLAKEGEKLKTYQSEYGLTEKNSKGGEKVTTRHMDSNAKTSIRLWVNDQIQKIDELIFKAKEKINKAKKATESFDDLDLDDEVIDDLDDDDEDDEALESLMFEMQADLMD